MSRLREKTTATLLITIFMISVFAVVAYAIEGTFLDADGTTGTEDRIVIDMPVGFTLGDLQSISWDYHLVAGYAPHVDIMLDIVVDGEADEALVVEYAYNDVDGTNIHEPCLTGTFYTTFDDESGNGGPNAVTDTTMAWATTGAPGPLGGAFGDDNFWFASIADWKAGKTFDSGSGVKTIDEDTLVLALEIEIDNWIVDTEAYVKNIQVNGLSTDLLVEVFPPIVSIMVSPASVDFGKLKYGAFVEREVTVFNIGDITVDVTADVEPEGEFFDLNLAVSDPGDIVPDGSSVVELDLTVTYGATAGIYAGTLVFWATPVYPSP